MSERKKKESVSSNKSKKSTDSDKNNDKVLIDFRATEQQQQQQEQLQQQRAVTPVDSMEKAEETTKTETVGTAKTTKTTAATTSVKVKETTKPKGGAVGAASKPPVKRGADDKGIGGKKAVAGKKPAESSADKKGGAAPRPGAGSAKKTTVKNLTTGTTKTTEATPVTIRDNAGDTHELYLEGEEGADGGEGGGMTGESVILGEGGRGWGEETVSRVAELRNWLVRHGDELDVMTSENLELLMIGTDGPDVATRAERDDVIARIRLVLGKLQGEVQEEVGREGEEGRVRGRREGVREVKEEVGGLREGLGKYKGVVERMTSSFEENVEKTDQSEEMSKPNSRRPPRAATTAAPGDASTTTSGKPADRRGTLPEPDVRLHGDSEGIEGENEENLFIEEEGDGDGEGEGEVNDEKDDDNEDSVSSPKEEGKREKEEENERRKEREEERKREQSARMTHRSRLNKTFYEESATLNFDKEYKLMKGGAGGPQLMDEASEKLTNQIEYIDQMTIYEVYRLQQRGDAREEGPLSVSAVTELLLEVKRVLKAGRRFVDEDVGAALTRLRDTIRAYVDSLMKKLRTEIKPISRSGGGGDDAGVLRRQADVQQRAIDIAKTLMELEKLANDVLENIALLDFDLNADLDLAQQANMEADAQADKEAEESEAEREERERREKEEEEEREREEERRRKEEEERKKKEEEEERRRKEEEEKRILEEEERKRKEREEEERIQATDPRHFPMIIYEFEDVDMDDTSRLACIVRAPESVELVKDQLIVTPVDMLTNRPELVTYEELVSNTINIRPSSGQDMNFENPIWLSVPYSPTIRGKELVIKVQYPKPPPTPPASSPPSPEPVQEGEQERERGQEGEEQEKKVGEEEEGETKDEGEGKGLEEKDGDTVKDTEGGKGRKEGEGDGVDERDGEREEREEKRKRRTAGPPPPPPAVINKKDKLVVDMAAAMPPAVEWTAVDFTRETTIEGQDSTQYRFVETPLKRIGSEGFNVHIVSRPKKDTKRIRKEGDKLIHSIDQRNSLTVPPNAFRFEVEIALQVIPIDSSALNGFKERHEDCEVVLGSSPLVRVSFPVKPLQPISVALTNPSGGNKNRRPDQTKGHGATSGGSGNKPGSSLPGLGGRTKTFQADGAELDHISLLTKETNGKWKHRDDIPLTTQKESTTFNIQEILDQMLLLRTSIQLESADLCKLAAKLETSLTERPAVVVVRQSAENPNNIYMECTKRENLDKLAQKLSERNGRFTDGPEPSSLIILREGDIIKVSCRGNIKFSGDNEVKPVIQVIFNSNLSSASLSASIKEVDQYAQNAFDQYRGNLQFSLVGRPYQAPPKLAQLAKRRPLKNQDQGFLCELPISLPKPPKEPLRKNRIEIAIPTEGPLSDEYFTHLSMELGEEWTRIAVKLGHDKASLQRINQTYSYIDGVEATQKAIRQMLVDWFKGSEKAKNKVDELHAALLEGSRADLAEELQTRNQEYRADIDKAQQEARLQKCIKAYADSQAALKQWRPVAKALGLTLQDIAEIGGAPPGLQVIDVEHVTDMLNRWRDARGENATRDHLILVLKKLKLNEAASNMQLVR